MSNNAGVHTVTFTVQIGNMPGLEDDAAIALYLDADDNASTGGPSGVECIFGVENEGWSLSPWDGSTFTMSDVDERAVHVTYSNGF